MHTVGGRTSCRAEGCECIGAHSDTCTHIRTHMQNPTHTNYALGSILGDRDEEEALPVWSHKCPAGLPGDVATCNNNKVNQLWVLHPLLSSEEGPHPGSQPAKTVDSKGDTAGVPIGIGDTSSWQQ